jgi:PPOX class probable F420-dependent enzyme
MSLDVHRERYVSLVTFKRDGSEVATPIWFAPDADDDALLWMYTNVTSWKIKRIRNQEGRARVAACDARGKLRGDYENATATVIDDASSPEFERAFATLIDRYGWQARAVLFFSRFGGRYPERCALAVRLSRSG